MINNVISLLLFLLVILLIPGSQAWNPGSSLLNYKDLLTEHLTSYTNIPRIFYKIERDYNDQIYKIKLNVRRNKAIPLHIIPYTPETWISAVYVPDLNVLPMVCDLVNSCIYDSTVEDTEMFYMNYTLRGTDGQLKLKGAMESYTNPMNFTLIRAEDWEQKVNFTHKMAPLTEPVSGGLGLGFGYNNSRIFFLRSFVGLEKQVASIFLSANEFDISSEMLIGDTNSAHIYLDTEKIVVNVTNFDLWSFNFTKIIDKDSKPFYNTEEDFTVLLDPNLPYLGVPKEAYESFIKAVETKYGITCGREPTMPNCTYPAGTQTEFQNLYFVKDKTQLYFPASLYVRANDTYCTLMIGDTSNINVIPDFKSYWVFGSPFMTYYYTVLNFTDQNKLEIDFYRAKTFKKTSKFYWIIGSISAFVALGSLLALYMLVRKDKTEKDEFDDSTLLDESAVNQSGLDQSIIDHPDINDELRRGTIDLFPELTKGSRRDTLALSAVTEEESKEASEFSGEGEIRKKSKRGDSLLQLQLD